MLGAGYSLGVSNREYIWGLYEAGRIMNQPPITCTAILVIPGTLSFASMECGLDRKDVGCLVRV
jgi:hypothetical protein